MEPYVVGIIAVVDAIVFLVAGYYLRRAIFERDLENVQRQSQRIIAEAQKEAQARRREAVVEAREQLSAERKAFEEDSRKARQELIDLEKQLAIREENLDKRSITFEQKEREVEKKNQRLEARLAKLDEQKNEMTVILEKQRRQLENIAGITESRAKEMLLENLEHEMQKEQALVIHRYTEETKEVAKRKAREILVGTIQRIASDEVGETTVSTVPLASDDMKGRIIGREGRNIRAFEATTGINLIIDDTPEAVVLSGFDPIRREAARQTLERLLLDGRIHPGRIEEVHHKVLKEMD